VKDKGEKLIARLLEIFNKTGSSAGMLYRSGKRGVCLRIGLNQCVDHTIQRFEPAMS